PFGDDENGFFDEGVSCRQPQESGLVCGNPAKPGQFLASVPALSSFSGQAVTDFELARRQIAHEAKTSDSSASIAAQIHNESAASFQCCDSAINIFRYINTNGAREHRDFE